MAKRLDGRTIESWAREAEIAWAAKEQAEAKTADAGVRIAELREMLEHRDARAERDAEATTRAAQEADARTMEARRERDDALDRVRAAERTAKRHQERATDRWTRIRKLDEQLRAQPVEGAAAYWKERADQAQAQAARLRERSAHQRQQIRELTARHVVTKKGFESQARTIGRLVAEAEAAGLRGPVPAVLISPDGPVSPSIEPGGWVTVSEGPHGWHSPVLQVLSVKPRRNVDGDCFDALLTFAGARAGASPSLPALLGLRPCPPLTVPSVIMIRLNGVDYPYRVKAFNMDSEQGLTMLDLDRVQQG